MTARTFFRSPWKVILFFVLVLLALLWLIPIITTLCFIGAQVKMGQDVKNNLIDTVAVFIDDLIQSRNQLVIAVRIFIDAL